MCVALTIEIRIYYCTGFKKGKKQGKMLLLPLLREKNTCVVVKGFVFLKVSTAISTTIYEYIVSRFL